MIRETILLVEDEHDIQELLRFHLERENLIVEAVESAGARRPHSCHSPSTFLRLLSG